MDPLFSLPLENPGSCFPWRTWVLPGKQPDIPLLNGAVQGLGSVTELWRAGGDGASEVGARPRAPAPQLLPLCSAPAPVPLPSLCPSQALPNTTQQAIDSLCRTEDKALVLNVLWCWGSGEASPLQSPPRPGGWVSWAAGSSGAGAEHPGLGLDHRPLAPPPSLPPPGPRRTLPLPGPPRVPSRPDVLWF